MSARTLMIQGTGSDVGKSLIAAGLCRIFRDRGLSVAPFKAQNMALNAAVTAGDGEIGRAQALQALAAGVEPHVDMNPILLKPEGDMRSQVVVLGKAQPTLSAQDYYARRDALSEVVAGALQRLRQRHDMVIVEGAGSAAELNLRDRDIVNMHVAHLAEAPVLLVADIDRGGIFASLLGTQQLLDDADRARLAGFVVNKFRGDPALFEDGVDLLERRSGLPVLGVVPYLHELRLNDEDSVPLDSRDQRVDQAKLQIAVLRLPSMSNHDDLLPLEAEQDVQVRYVTLPNEARDADLVVLPGSKYTRRDLQWLRQRGLAQLVAGRAAQGLPVLGICGGFQMLGARIEDPVGVEGPPGEVRGLGLLPIETRFTPDKVTRQVTAEVLDMGFVSEGLAPNARVQGYEIHMGQVVRTGGAPALRVHHGESLPYDDGSALATGHVVGTLVHGIFEDESLRDQMLHNLWARRGEPRPHRTRAPTREQELDRLAAHLQAHLDIEAVARLAGL